MLKVIFKHALPMMGTRALNMAMPVVDMVIVANVFFLFSGSLLLATQLVQIFIVVATSSFVGVHILLPKLIKNGDDNHRVYESLYLSVFLGTLCTLLVISLAYGYFDDDIVIYSTLILSLGLIPLFGYTALLANLESSGFEKNMVQVSWYSNVMNLVVSLACVLWLNHPVFGVCLGTTIVRTYMFVHAILIAYRLGFFQYKGFDTGYLRDTLRISFPEVLSRVIFVAMMTVVIGLSADQLSDVDFASFSVVMSYMNFLFVVGLSIPIALSVAFARLDFNLHSFMKCSIASVFIFYICSLLLIPITVFIFGQNVSLMPLFILGASAIVVDLVNMNLVTYSRLIGFYAIAPYTRLLLFFVLIFYLYAQTEISATGLLSVFLLGNCVGLIVLCILVLMKQKKLGAYGQSL